MTRREHELIVVAVVEPVRRRRLVDRHNRVTAQVGARHSRTVAGPTELTLDESALPQHRVEAAIHLQRGARRAARASDRRPRSGARLRVVLAGALEQIILVDDRETVRQHVAYVADVEVELDRLVARDPADRRRQRVEEQPIGAGAQRLGREPLVFQERADAALAHSALTDQEAQAIAHLIPQVVSQLGEPAHPVIRLLFGGAVASDIPRPHGDAERSSQRFERIRSP